MARQRIFAEESPCKEEDQEKDGRILMRLIFGRQIVRTRGGRSTLNDGFVISGSADLVNYEQAYTQSRNKGRCGASALGTIDKWVPNTCFINLVFC
jgi:hypothetical protein